MQLCLNFNLTADTWVTEALCISRVSSWQQTPFLEQSTRRWYQTPRRFTCPAMWLQQPSGYVTWCMNDFVYTETEGVLQLHLDKVARECRLGGQDRQILRQVSPIQSHQSNERQRSPQCADLLEHIFFYSKHTLSDSAVDHQTCCLDSHSIQCETRHKNDPV